MTNLLDVKALDAFYGDFQALFGIDFSISAGETVALVGANGAGKSTFLRSLTGLVPDRNARIVFNGLNLGGLPAYRIAREGIAMVPEGRRLFPSLNVEENLLMGTDSGRKGAWSLEKVFSLFPVLRDRRNQKATSLSGGQQQMVAIGRALLSNPLLLLCDELSLGLAPVVIEEIYAAVPQIKADGCALVIVEQDVRRALDMSDRVVCFLEGHLALARETREVSFDVVSAAYMGKAAEVPA
ncbi:ABC transporter ATP-binding protein [Rhizobium calliandrae]|uniref:ABC transporter ATP-binding protein n=1 Tax=Rhizobium calliandrae TaxID=1312182 RepID=A0ABT7KPH0_9HYPH|nr:ABC transporter ATP-binding protein [Rhizobium calliandrae]MDL2410533.1 ABC transporter ATP-binding protein [Rhizobium calliandrae]